MEAAADDTNLQIFKQIGELMVDSEFVSANAEFFKQHCDTFDANVEENKHEYKQIYEEFLKIQEDVIEGKLKESYTEDQVLEFYSAFEDNMKAYDAENKETLDFLFEMIDFDKFKAKMCSMKASFLKEQEQQEEFSKQENGQELKAGDAFDIEKESQALTALLGESLTSKEIGWKKRVEQKDWKNDLKVTIHSRKQEASKLDIFRCEVQFRGQTYEAIQEFWWRPPAEKMSMMVDCQQLDMEYHADGRMKSCTRYTRTAMPMITDRDTVLFMYGDKMPDGKDFLITKSKQDDRFPLAKNCIRMFQYDLMSWWTTEEDGVPIVNFLGYCQFDAKGYIPASLLNLTGANGFLDFFKEMMKVLKDK